MVAEPRVTITLRLDPLVADKVRDRAGPRGMNAFVAELLAQHVGVVPETVASRVDNVRSLAPWEQPKTDDDYDTWGA